MDELLMKMMADAVGLEVFCFLVDFKTAGGEDRHRALFAMGSDVQLAVQGAISQMKEQGSRVTCITQYEGFHTEDALLDYAANGTTVPYRFLYINP